jgi:hypothetical protein
VEDSNKESAENMPKAGSDESVVWTASEFIAHEKSAGWYINLAVAAVLLAGLTFLVTRDGVSAAVVIVGAVFFAIFAARKPRQLEYGISRYGVSIAAKQYGFQDFKSFSLVQEGAFGAINFMPLKRFAPVLTIYYEPTQEQQILSILAEHLPFEEARPDRVESLMRLIRF